jgi:hypothetical protein
LASAYDSNTFLLPVEKTCNMPHKMIKHMDIEAITKTNNPYCVETGKKLRIKKDVYDKLVKIA